MKKKSSEPTVKRQRKSGLVYTTLAQEFLKAVRPHLRTIKRMSEMSQVPIGRVSTDVIENGIASAMETYVPMMKMEEQRKQRAERIKRMFDEQSPSETTGPGSPEEQADLGELKPGTGTEDEGSANGATLDFSGATLVRPGDADVEPRYEPEVDEAVGSVISDS